MNPILFHINYFEQGQTTERACELARQLGADGVEFRRKPGAFKGTDLEYLDEVSRALERHPLEWISFGGPGVNLMTGDPETTERELAAAEAFFRKAAGRFPLKVVNSFTGTLANADKSLPFVEYWHHGSTVATPAQWEAATAGFQRMGALAGELGFRFAFETHGVYLHDTVEATMKLVSAINSPNVGLLWDHANLMLFPTSPSLEEVITRSGDKLFYVHLKNLLFSPSRFLAVSSLSGGIINVREQVKRLLASGYTGPIAIEAPRQGDREQFAKEDLAYIREVLESANAS
ncbi:MAG TPA: sugar phosphate isomerase/epimerase [Chthoniobacteraceae bacterium]|nr:sugar phosphate isomerase/epimerase [Chthoniobacteraceae bacterium]